MGMVMAVRNFPRPGQLERHAHNLAVTHAATMHLAYLCRSTLLIEFDDAFDYSGADSLTSPRHVRFAPKSGHSSAHWAWLVCAKSEHSVLAEFILLVEALSERPSLITRFSLWGAFRLGAGPDECSGWPAQCLWDRTVQSVSG